MGDLINRQAAINAIENTECELLPEEWDELTDAIMNLPSAQPDRSLWFRIGEICVDESKGFISAGRAIEKIRELLREAERREDE